MLLHNLKTVAAALDIKLSSLRVYVGRDMFPIEKIGNRVFITIETFENLKWMKEQGLPIAKYEDISNKPFRDAYCPEGRVNGWRNDKWIDAGERYTRNAKGEIIRTPNSGLGDNGSDSTTNVYDVPKELIIWGEDQTTMSIPNLRKKVKSILDELKVYEDALREKDKGYTGRTIVATAPGLVGELQQTISEQEKELEKKDKELKKQENYYLGKLTALIEKHNIYPTMTQEEIDKADNIEFITVEMLNEAIRQQNKPR